MGLIFISALKSARVDHQSFVHFDACDAFGRARRRHFQHARIVEGMQAGIELGVGPDCAQIGRAGVIGAGAFSKSAVLLNAGTATRPFIWFAIATKRVNGSMRGCPCGPKQAKAAMAMKTRLASSAMS